MKDLRILLVDDNATFSASVERALRLQGYSHVQAVGDAWQALESIQKERPDLILLDLYLPGMDGLHLITAIHKIDKNIRVLMLSCEADEQCINAATDLGAVDYLVKPVKISSLVSSIESRV